MELVEFTPAVAVVEEELEEEDVEGRGGRLGINSGRGVKGNEGMSMCEEEVGGKKRIEMWRNHELSRGLGTWDMME